MNKKYTCPMHPQIEQSSPGDCPICGMDLELQRKTGDDNEANIHLKNMLLRFWVGVFFAAPIFFLNIFQPSIIHDFFWIQPLLATPIVLWCGWPFFVRGFYSIIQAHLNMFTLISLGVSTAYIYSLIATFWPSSFPVAFRGSQGQVDVYFEAASAIIILVILGQILESKARIKTSQAIEKLLNLSPPKATLVLPDQTEKEISLEEVKKGDVLRVKPGEKVPIDGVILEGKSFIDESMMTGESSAVIKNTGDSVIGATLNGDGSFLMKAEKVGNETLLSQIVDLVSKAQRSQAPIQKMADVVASYFVPAVIFCSLVTFFIWGFWGPEPSFAYGLINAVAVLMIACPCALGLATPMSVTVGIGKGALSGLFIKNAEVLEIMAKVDLLVVDKTGTLTEGKPKLIEVISLSEKSENEILQLAASLEVSSEHPLAFPILVSAKEKNLKLFPVNDFENVKGKGIIGKIEGNEVAIGNQHLFDDLKIDLSKALEKSQELLNLAQTVFYIGINRQIIGMLSVADVIKKSSFEAIKILHQEGIRIVMLTGDHKITATAVGKSLGIDEVEAEVLPEDKNKIIKEFQSQGHIVAMAGDGINDAPALAVANVGIAMGSGSDIAMESAGITLLKGDLRGIVGCRKLSEATVNNIKQNLCFAFIYNVIGIPIAAGVFYPFFGLLLSPIIASGAMAFSSVSVILNALRLKKAKL